VDDHVPLLKAMAGLLESYGAKVRSYQNGRDFLQEMPPVDCLILDYYMPNMNGLQLAAELRERGYGAPIVILTGISDEIPEEVAAATRIREIVDKFSGGDALLRAIERAIGKCAE
jgi:two-component system response regulator FixJ